MSLSSVLVTFPVAMTKYPDKSSLREKGLILTPFEGEVHQGGEVVLAGASYIHSQVGILC